MKKFLIKLIVIIFGILLAILFLEIILHLLPAATWKGLISKNPTRYILYQSHKDIGWVHIPDTRTNWQGTGEYDVELQINSLGLRDREHTYEKPPDTFRVLVLGDSFANAIETPLEQIFPIKLEDCLNDRIEGQTIEVINAGVVSYSPADQLLFFSHEGVKYQPDLVLTTIYVANDIVRDLDRDIDDNMIQSFGGYQFYLDNGQLKKQWIEWAEPNYEISGFEQFLRRYSTLYYVFRAPDSRVRREVNKIIDRWWPDSAAPEPTVKTPSDFPDYAYNQYLIIFASGFPDNPIVPARTKALWKLFEAVVLELQTQVKAQNARLAVVLIPRAAQIHDIHNKEFISEFLSKYDSLNNSDWDNWDFSAPNQAVINFMADHSIPTLDLMPGFRAYATTHDDLLYFRKDIHFNEKGHQLAADLMCDWLIEDELVPLQ